MSATPELMAFVARQNARTVGDAVAAFARHFYTDPAFDEIAKAESRIDANWTGLGWKPSELLTIGYCVLKTSKHPTDAKDFLEQGLAA